MDLVDLAANRNQRGLGKPETFTFLGFIHICGKSRRGAFQLPRKTRGDRMRAKLQEINEQLRQRMHEPIPVQGRWLKQVVTGFFAYHAVPTNAKALSTFRHYVTDRWRRTLRRRSRKDGMTWERIRKIADAWLPQPRILHPWPDRRLIGRWGSSIIRSIFNSLLTTLDLLREKRRLREMGGFDSQRLPFQPTGIVKRIIRTGNG